MKNIIFILLGMTLLASCGSTKQIVKPKAVVIGNDTSFTIMQGKYLSGFNEDERITVYNSELIKIEETFCWIGDEKKVTCISNTIKQLSPGRITKVIRKTGRGVKQVVVSYYQDDYIYNLAYFKNKDAYGAEEFVLSGELEIIFKGKPFTITASTTGVCKLLVKK